MNHQINLIRIRAVYNALSDLKDKVVFVGGATVSLYPDRITFNVRPTDDIDVIIEVLNYSERLLLEEKLRIIGFTHDIESGVICRYRIKGLIVDIMPTTPESIGFSNIWYPEGFKYAIELPIDESHKIKILSSPYFIATKLEAFKSRGNSDGRTSQDFEDIIFVLENREKIWQELKDTKGEIKKYLVKEFTELKNNRFIFDWIDSHIESRNSTSTYFILEEIDKFLQH